MEFYKKLKEERIKDELSQEELADKLNISRQSISKWELENSYPNIETLITLSRGRFFEKENRQRRKSR